MGITCDAVRSLTYLWKQGIKVLAEEGTRACTRKSTRGSSHPPYVFRSLEDWQNRILNLGRLMVICKISCMLEAGDISTFSLNSYPELEVSCRILTYYMRKQSAKYKCHYWGPINTLNIGNFDFHNKSLRLTLDESFKIINWVWTSSKVGAHNHRIKNNSRFGNLYTGSGGLVAPVSSRETGSGYTSSASCFTSCRHRSLHIQNITQHINTMCNRYHNLFNFRSYLNLPAYCNNLGVHKHSTQTDNDCRHRWRSRKCELILVILQYHASVF